MKDIPRDGWQAPVLLRDCVIRHGVLRREALVSRWYCGFVCFFRLQKRTAQIEDENEQKQSRAIKGNSMKLFRWCRDGKEKERGTHKLPAGPIHPGRPLPVTALQATSCANDKASAREGRVTQPRGQVWDRRPRTKA